jgi:hypothetical protein
MLYDAGLYVTVQKTLYEAWGPPNVGGILEPAAILATIILALCGQESRHSHSRLAQRWRSCSLFRWCSSSSSHRPNEAFRAATPTSVPPNWTELRVSWEKGHSIRFGLQLVALGLLILSVLVEVPPRTGQRV